MRIVKRKITCKIVSQIPQKYYNKQRRVNSNQNIHLINKPKTLKNQVYNGRDFNDSILKLDDKTNKINLYDPFLTHNYSSSSYNYNNQKNFNNYQNLLKTNNTITKSSNYNCDNYQYFYNFYLDNPLYSKLQENSIGKLYKSLNNSKEKKRIYHKPNKTPKNILSEEKNKKTIFEVIYDNKPSYIINTDYNRKKSNLTRKNNLNSNLNSNLYNTLNYNINNDLICKTESKHKFSRNNFHSPPRLTITNTDEAYSTVNTPSKTINFNEKLMTYNNSFNKNKKNIYSKKINSNTNETKKFKSIFINKEGLHYKEIKKFFYDHINYKTNDKNSLNKKNSDSIFDNVYDVQKKVLLIQSFFRKHLSHIKYCILKIMTKYIVGLSTIEYVFYKQNLKKLINNINNLYPQNYYYIKSKERQIPKFNMNFYEELNNNNLLDNKKLVYYCFELPSNINNKNFLIEDAKNGKIKLKNQIGNLPQNASQNYFYSKTTINNSTRKESECEHLNHLNTNNDDQNFPNKYIKKLMKVKKSLLIKK